MQLVLTRYEAKILLNFLHGKKLKSFTFREYAILNDIAARLERGTENEF